MPLIHALGRPTGGSSLLQTARKKKDIHVTNGTQWRSWLVNDRWFNHAPASLQDSLLTGMRQKRVTPGKLIIKRGDDPCGLYALLAGSVRFNEVSTQRHWLARPTTARPYWLGEVSLFDDRPRRHDVFAEDQVILLHIPREPLDLLLDEHPHHVHAFGKLLGQKLGLQVPSHEQMTLLPTEERVAFRLLVLSEGFGDLDHSQRVIALDDVPSRRCLGLAPDVLERVLATFAERRIIRLDKRRISVLDVDRLRRTARHRLTQPAY